MTPIPVHSWIIPDIVLGLKNQTDPAWAQVALADETSLLRDHAHLERKAAGHVISLMGQVPWAQRRLFEVAAEELEHFDRVLGLLESRNETLGSDPGNPYVQQLVRATGRSLLDRLLRMGLIEARSYEHFCLLGEAAPEGALKNLFNELKDSEAGHHALFVKLAYENWPREMVDERWTTLANAEAEIITTIEWGPRVH